MKKIFLLGLLLFAMTLVGCSRDALEVYKEATLKTDTIEYAKSKTELDIEVDFADDLAEEGKEIKELIEHITYSNDTIFDKKANKKIIRQFIGSNTLGFDTVFYNDNGNEYLKIPFLGKFIRLDDLGSFDNELFGDVNFEEPPISEESMSQISKLWLELVNKDDVVNLGNEVVDTPEGEVKVKKIVVTFKNDQLKEFSNQVLDVIKKDEKFKEEISNYPAFIVDENGEMAILDVEEDKLDPEEIIESLREFIDFIIFDEFEVTTYIDIDDYIVNEEFKIIVSFNDAVSEVIEFIKFESFYQLYDIGEKIKFSFPELDETNTTTLKEALEGLDFDVPLND